MGPPSRYSVIASRRTIEPMTNENQINEFDTSHLSNTEWALRHLQRLVLASSPEEFKNETGSVFARTVNITINGLHVSRDRYALQWGAAFSAGGTMTTHSTIETPHIQIPTFTVSLIFHPSLMLAP